LLGVALGLLLPRPWAEVPEAEAARRTTWTCLGDLGFGHVRVFNPTNKATTFHYLSYQADGSPGGDDEDFPLGPHELKRLGANAGYVTLVSSAAPILVGGDARQTNADAGYQTPCFKGK
jgi:hypothetical protein